MDATTATKTMTGVDLERTCILDDYSAQLARRDKALDSRETLIDRREKELHISRERVSAQARELELLKSTLFAERAGVQTQKHALAGERKEIDGKASVIRDLIKTSKTYSAELQGKKHELRTVNENLAQMYAALKAAQESMETLRLREKRTGERESKCTDIVIALDNRQKELDTLQNELHRLQITLSQRENNVAHAIQVIPLKDCLPELKQVARDYAEFRARRNTDTETPDIDNNVNAKNNSDPKEHTRKLKDFFNDIRTFARSLEAREAAAIRREDALASREKQHDEAAAALSARESDVAAKTRDLKSAQRKQDEESRASRSMWEKSEENLRRISDMESALDSREASIAEQEARVADKLKNMERQKTLITAQEKSIKRTGNSLKGLEAGLRRDAQKVQQERNEIKRIEDDIEAREKLLQTKTVEIEVREARLKRDIFSSAPNINTSNEAAAGSRPPTRTRHRKSKSKTRALQENENDNDDSTARNSSNQSEATESSGSGWNYSHTDQVGNDRGNNNDSDDDSDALPKENAINIDADDVVVGSTAKAGISDTSDLPVQQRTVRKQLTFGQTPNVNISRNSAAVEETSTSATSSSSEHAAEQLHGELRAARAVWIEKVNRLDSVVTSMSQDLTSTGTQLLPVIRTVRTELHRIRDEASDQNGNNNGTFGEEQNRHRHWAHVMTQQLKTIKEVQAGLLHAFNRVLPPPNDTQYTPSQSQYNNTQPQPSPTPQERAVYQPSPLPREPLLPRQTQPREQRTVTNKKKNVNSNARSDTSSSEEQHQTLEKLLRVIDGNNKNKQSTTSVSVYSNKNKNAPQPKQYRMAAPLRGAWADIDRVASISRTPRTTSEELAALRKELGLDN